MIPARMRITDYLVTTNQLSAPRQSWYPVLRKAQRDALPISPPTSPPARLSQLRTDFNQFLISAELDANDFGATQSSADAMRFCWTDCQGLK